MKAVEYDRRPRCPALHGFDVAASHVDGDELNLARPMLAESVEESVDGCRLPTNPDPDHALSVVIRHYREVMMPPLVGYLVDPDSPQPVQRVAWTAAPEHACRNATDGLPRDAHQPANAGLVHPLSQKANGVLEVAGERAARVGPGHELARYTAPGTVHTLKPAP